MPQPEAPSALPKAALWPDAANVTLLAGLAISFAYISWGKWPDPQVDFGRELYLPWRISQGAVLYKDELHLYGPLSQYLNSLFFRAFGVGLTTLVMANAVIYSAILGLLYYLVREGWGRWAAFASCAFFIGVFSFSHLVGVSNYNFLTPYSHEMTHGTLLVLCLVLVLRRCIRELSAGWVILAGLLAGLAVLVKPEIIFSAAVATAGAVVLIVRRAAQIQVRGLRTHALIFTAAGLTPMIAAAMLFWLFGGVSPRDALHFSNFAWLSMFEGKALFKDPFQQAALGFDHPWQNLAREIIWGGAAVGTAAGLAWAVTFFRGNKITRKVIASFFFLLAGLAAMWVPWMNLGYALPVILFGGALLEIARMRAAAATKSVDDGAAARILLWMAATAMLARMALNPRIYHYGFVQAALAGTVAVAILASSIPELLRLTSVERRWYQALLTLVVAAVIGVVAFHSVQIYAAQTFSLGKGADQFYAFDEKVDPTGLVVEQARQYIEEDARKNNIHSLLVVPDGVMLNYLTRLPNSIPYFFFAPFVLADERGDDIIRRLTATPPDRIVVLSRDMREFGVARFGDSPGHGQKLVEFIERNYQTIYSFGDDPFDPDSFGFIVYSHNSKL